MGQDTSTRLREGGRAESLRWPELAAAASDRRRKKIIKEHVARAHFQPTVNTQLDFFAAVFRTRLVGLNGHDTRILVRPRPEHSRVPASVVCLKGEVLCL